MSSKLMKADDNLHPARASPYNGRGASNKGCSPPTRAHGLKRKRWGNVSKFKGWHEPAWWQVQASKPAGAKHPVARFHLAHPTNNRGGHNRRRFSYSNIPFTSSGKRGCQLQRVGPRTVTVVPPAAQLRSRKGVLEYLGFHASTGTLLARTRWRGTKRSGGRVVAEAQLRRITRYRKDSNDGSLFAITM